jgi:ketosteroid isomerase-like protein
MLEHPNSAIARRAWDAVARGDAEALRELLASDVVWRATARNAPWAGLHRGPDVILDMLARVGEVTDSFDAQLVDVLVSEERAVLLFRVRLGVGGRRAEVEYALLGRIEEGRFRELWTAPLDPSALEVLWAP